MRLTQQYITKKVHKETIRNRRFPPSFGPVRCRASVTDYRNECSVVLSTLPSNTVQVRKAIGNVGSGKESAGVWVR